MNKKRKQTMMIFLKPYITRIMGLALTLALFTQAFGQQVKEKAAIFSKAYPQEKVYVQLDKNYYLPGETIWMKAYVVAGPDHQASELSKVLYIDLIDPDEALVGHHIVYVFSGEAVSDFDLPLEAIGGRYRIRAYTQWMRNFDQSFQTSLQVLETGEFLATPQGSSDLPDVQFLPEGGDWVGGIPNTLAIKAVGPDGLGVSISGSIKNGEGTTLGTFESTHLGMGKVSLTPEAGNTYTAEIAYQGKRFEVALPEVKTQGATLAVGFGEGTFDLNLTASSRYEGNRYRIVGAVRGNVLYEQTGSWEQGPSILNVPATNFPTGVVQFTLFDEANKPVAERLVFNSQDEALRVFVNVDETRFQRQQVEVEITVADNKGNAVETPLSMAVVHADGLSTEQPDRSSLLSHFWLSSDLAGFVEQAPRYFEDGGYGRKELDLVMRTHGWRGFAWEEILDAQPRQLAFEPEKGLEIGGSVRLKSGEPLAGGEITLVLDNILNTFQTEADASGRFLFPGMLYLDTTQVFIQGRTAKRKRRELDFSLDERPSWDVEPYLILDGFVKDDEFWEEKAYYLESGQEFVSQKSLIEGIAQYELGPVQIVAREPDAEEKRKRRRTLYGQADFTLEGEDVPQVLTVSQALQGRVPGVQVFQSIQGPRISIRGSRNQPLFLLDEVPTDIGLIDAIPMPDIEAIDVIKGPKAAIYGGRGAGGVVAVYTKRGQEGGVPDETATGIIKAELQGFHVPRIFYAPVYDADQGEGNAPDLRSTVFWHPVIRTDKNGKAKVRYYNGDLTGEFFLTLEGISPTGQPAYKQILLEVE